MRKLQLSHSKFLSLAEMIKKACDPNKPTFVSRLPKNAQSLDEVYTELYHDFRMYKLDTNDPDFNSLDEDGKDKFENNDSWMDSIKEEYYDLAEKADTKLEDIAKSKEQEMQKNIPEVDPEVKNKELIRIKVLAEEQYKAEKKSIADSITSMSNAVSNYQENSIGVVQGLAIRASLSEVSARIDGALSTLFEKLISVSDDALEGQTRGDHFEFTSLQRARIDSVEVAIVSKAREAPLAAAQGHHGAGHGGGAGKTFLRKVDPPKFTGDILEFPEFKRKWAANVTRENLEEESELDRLRDNVPESAKKMLIGEKSLSNAWKILTTMYGNKTMLANKLKGKLKSIKSQGKEDYDVVINLAIEVKGIIKSLTEMSMQEMLKYDDEYLSAIYKALPARERDKWLNFDKAGYETEWGAMEVFLEIIREKATNSKVLLSNYAAHDAEEIKCRKCHKFGHKKADCTELASASAKAAFTTRANKDASSDEEDMKDE